MAVRKDLVSKIDGIGIDLFNPMPHLDMEFNEKEIPFVIISDDSDVKQNITETYLKYWLEVKWGKMGKFESVKKTHLNKPAYTISASHRNYHPTIARYINDYETKLIQSFPHDYNYLNKDCNYLTGMSVPPIAMAQIATRIKEQWFDRMNL